MAASNSKELAVATLNVNGLPSFRQNAHTKSLLASYQIRHRELCRQLEDSDIDIINLQEVFTHRDRRLFETRLPSFDYASFVPDFFGPKGALMTFSRLPMETVRYESYRDAAKTVDMSELPRFSRVKSGMKGVLISRLTTMPLTIVNTHPLANDDWDWSEYNRFHDLQMTQLTALAAVVHDVRQSSEVILGCDMNVAKSSPLFEAFLGKSGLHDMFYEDTGPTFHAAFLAAGRHPQAIDFLLASSGIHSENMRHIFTDKVAMERQGDMYLTDHHGLRATVRM